MTFLVFTDIVQNATIFFILHSINAYSTVALVNLKFEIVVSN